MKVYGIDLGTTYSVIATIDNYGLPKVIKNVFEASADGLASVVYFPVDDDPSVGKEAKARLQYDDEKDRVVECIKRKIGKTNETVIEHNGRKLGPIEISAIILKRLSDYAKEQGEDVCDVVITCPAYFKIEQREATRQAGEEAGLNVLRIVDEPTAAAINYCFKGLQETKRILVYDLGGGTFDVTLLDMTVESDSKTTIEILSTEGNDFLGGKDWDDLLNELMLQKFSEKTGVSVDEISSRTRSEIKSKVEDLKISLSNSARKSLSFEDNNRKLQKIEVTRDEFEEKTAFKLDLTIALVEKVFDDLSLLGHNDITKDTVDIVLLVGGSSKMPMVKNAVERLFPGKTQIEEPDLGVAMGAARIAEISLEEIDSTGKKKQKKGNQTNKNTLHKKTEIREIVTCSFGVGIMCNLKGTDDKDDDEYVVDNLVYFGDQAPAVATGRYQTRYDNQTGLNVRVFQNICKQRNLPNPHFSDKTTKYFTPCVDRDGNPQKCDESLCIELIGELSIPIPPNQEAGYPVEVDFTLDYNGLNVVLRDPNTNTSKELFIQSKFTNDKVTVDDNKKFIGELVLSSD